MKGVEVTEMLLTAGLASVFSDPPTVSSLQTEK
jgi:hypothetical protein